VKFIFDVQLGMILLYTNINTPGPACKNINARL